MWNLDTRQYDFFYVGYRVEDNYYRWGRAIRLRFKLYDPRLFSFSIR